jgi:hypothetical protein
VWSGRPADPRLLPPRGTKVIPFNAIRSVRRVDICVLSGRAKIRGTANPKYSLSIDAKRPSKKVGLVMRTSTSTRRYSHSSRSTTPRPSSDLSGKVPTSIGVRHEQAAPASCKGMSVSPLAYEADCPAEKQACCGVGRPCAISPGRRGVGGQRRLVRLPVGHASQ